jgi:hypothetical protein
MGDRAMMDKLLEQISRIDECISENEMTIICLKERRGELEEILRQQQAAEQAGNELDYQRMKL